MREKFMGTHEYSWFTLLILGWMFWLWISLILALSGTFHTPLLWGVLILLVIAKIYFFFTQGWFRKLSKEYFAISTLIILIVTTLSFFVSPTVFSGRDQGSYSAAAIHLAQTRQLTFSTPASEVFFDLYGPGKALNFPGFHYAQDGKLTTQFPLGYIAWLASAYALFGLSGLVIANAVTAFIFLLSIYLFLRRFTEPFYALWGIAFASTSFIFAWFMKFTLSENLALALFVSLILNLTLFFKNQSQTNYFAVLATAGFFVFTRIEGCILLPLSLLLLFFTQRSAQQFWKTKPWKYVIFPTLLFIAIFTANAFASLPFYKTIAKALVREWSFFSGAPFSFLSLAPAHQSASLAQVLRIYGLSPIFLVGFIGSVVLWKRHRSRLLPFVLAIPTLLYFIQPNISSDHPWMLRRFAFSLWPAALLLAILSIAAIQQFLTQRYPYLALFKKRWYAGILLSALFFSQLPLFFRYLTFVENITLLPQIQTLGQSFTDRDLILVSRLATGDPWNMMAEPLALFSHLNAVYFFNPDDLSKLDTSRFENVYFIVSEAEVSDYIHESDPRFTLVRPYTLQTQRLANTTDNQLPAIFPQTTSGLIFKISQ